LYIRVTKSDTQERRPSAAVLQKKRVIFLGWFHHTTVMLYCWHAFHNCIAPGLWFATMNYLVHSVMYTYYFLMVFKPLRPYARAIGRVGYQLIFTRVVLQSSKHQTMTASTCTVHASQYDPCSQSSDTPRSE
jgi:elongation of very long chain fatty acids protein 6